MELEKINTSSFLQSLDEISSDIKRSYGYDWSDPVGESFWYFVKDFNSEIEGLQGELEKLSSLYSSVESLNIDEIRNSSKSMLDK